MNAAAKCKSENAVMYEASFCRSWGTRARSFDTTNILNDDIIARDTIDNPFASEL